MMMFDPDESYTKALDHDEILRSIAHRAAYSTIRIMRTVLVIAMVIALALTPLHEGWLTLVVVLGMILMTSLFIYEAQLSAHHVPEAATELMHRSRAVYSTRTMVLRSLIDALGSALALTVLWYVIDEHMSAFQIAMTSVMLFISGFAVTLLIRRRHARRMS